MKCILFGAAGQLGSELLREAPSKLEVIPVSRNELDLINTDQVRAYIESIKPDMIVNASAYTAVDQAENERDIAFRVNGYAPRVMAEYVSKTDTYLLHVSTDFVFDGTKSSPYKPSDKPNPLNVYGASKLNGEQGVLKVAPENSAIIRTAWVYSAQGMNFVRTMLRLFLEKRAVSVVADQVGTPTSTKSLAQCIWKFLETRIVGIHHWTDAGVASWYDFAVAVLEYANELNIINSSTNVIPIKTEEFPVKAVRPAYSVLDWHDSAAILGYRPAHWRTRLHEVLKEMTK